MPDSTVKTVDPILAAVLDSRFSAIVDLVAGAMMRTSMSPIFAEARDIAAAIFDKDLRLIAQRDWLPVLASNCSVAIKEIAEYWEGEVEEGDVFIHNDAFGRNSHQPDVNVAKPVFHDGQIAFWVMAKGHHADIGGKGICGYDPNASTCWDDGLVLKPAKLYQAGKINRSLWDFIKSNTKLPVLGEADLNCQIGACVTGERALVALMDQYGHQAVEASLDTIMDATERGLRAKISELTPGVYYGEKAIDDDVVNRGIPVTVRAKVTVMGDGEIEIDLSDSDPQVPSYMNSTWGNTYSVSTMAVLYFMPGDTKRNAGALRPIKLITKKGTFVDPEFPAACSMCTCSMTETIFEAITLALAQTKPEWATAAHGKMSLHISTGFNPNNERPFATIDFATCANGSGGTEGYDGWPMGGPTHCMGQLRSPDPEIMEIVLPVIIWQLELTGGREGAGKYRGGVGANYRVEYTADATAVECGQGHADWAVPTGLFGGTSPIPNAPRVLRKDTGERVRIPVNTFWDIKAGDIYEQDMQGGAGWGNPFERNPESVLKDFLDEFLTADDARQIYGVVIDEAAQSIDWTATHAARAAGPEKGPGR
ncbi:MAG: hydantoinase B/oxoprolinase family protein [Actinobacteria bacterium]|nr:hydantoinase B/oxoprolinase family protein [Actinomycetota bacterium]